MSNSTEYDIKMEMLRTFDKELDEIFNQYHQNKLTLKQFFNRLNQFKYVWGSCRLDIKNYGDHNNDIQFLEDKNIYIINPVWFNDEEGSGYKVEIGKNKVVFTLKCIQQGVLRVFLRGLDYRIDNQRKPIFINFTKMVVNDEIIFDENRLLWHDAPEKYEKFCQNDEEIKIKIEFKSIFNYYPQLSKEFKQIKTNEDIENLRKTHNIIKDYLKCEKVFNQFEEINNPSVVLYDFYKNNNLITDNNNEILSSYNSFQKFYLNYAKNKGIEINHLVNKLNSRLNQLENKIIQLEEETNSYVDSDNLLFNTILVDHQLKPAPLLNNLQMLCSQLLLFVSNICKKHEINWWLDYGTLLGSIRHEGFIPWDDDLDVGMMRTDYHNFIEVMYDEIEEHGLSDIIEVAYRYRKYNDIQINSFIQLFVKDLKNNKTEIMAGLDVFPYDYMIDYDNSTFGDTYNQTKRKFYSRLTHGSETSSVYMGLDYDEVINEYYENLNLSYDEQEYIIPGVEGAFGYNGTNLYEVSVLKHEEIFPLKQNKFGELFFPVPNNYESILTKTYGDYLKVPKIVRTHGRTDDFRKMPNINKTFDTYISKFKKANEEF